MEERQRHSAPPVWFRTRGHGLEPGLHPESLSAKLAARYEGTEASAKHRLFYDVPVGRSARWRRRRQTQEALLYSNGRPTKSYITEKSLGLERSIEAATGQTAWHRISTGECTAAAKARMQRNLSMWRHTTT